MTLIPNSFQTPNAYVDEAMHLLTDPELRCLIFATRHILGWQDKINKRRGAISLSMFENGYNGYAGTGLGRPTIIKAVDGLVQYGFLTRIEEPTPDGQVYELNLQVDWQTLAQRQLDKRAKDKDRTAKAVAARQAKRAGGMSDIPEPGMSDIPPASMSDIPNQSHLQSHLQSQLEASGDAPASKTKKTQKEKQPRPKDALYEATVWAIRLGEKANGGVVGNYKGMLTGKGKKGEWKDYSLDPPMTAEEICAFGFYLRRASDVAIQKAETLARHAGMFRSAEAQHARDMERGTEKLAELLKPKPVEPQQESIAEAKDELTSEQLAELDAMKAEAIKKLQGRERR